MGLIKAALGSVGGVLADQWKDYFYCDSLSSTVLMAKGQKRESGRSSNTRGSDNIITNGSLVIVNEGQCMMIVEQGKVVDLCAEPGEYTYDFATEPSIFTGDLEESIRASVMEVGKRFTFGGEAPKDQRIYYFNTKEIIGMKYGTPSPVPFRVVDERAAIDIDISVSCFGQYSFKLADPVIFYTNVCGNVTDEFDLKGSELEGQMRSEFLTALQPAFARLSTMGLRYSALPGHTQELSDAMKAELSGVWRADRGIEIAKVGMNSIKAPEEDEKMIKEMQRNAAFMDPTRAAAHIVGAQGDAMKAAASNTAGAMAGFMGMGMAQGVAGGTASNLFQMGQQVSQPAPAPAAGWTCSCGHSGNTGKFCSECGQPAPAPAAGWTCSCGAVNKGKFCSECGSPKPAGVPQYKCDKCGWEPEPGVKAPKFCPECGDPFDDGDLV
ncbi:MAG: SPFH domain-containing protein [Firmicutes bacterium]|nr:SPFH domain-containing protein [Bacillota bacterium]